MVFSLLAGVVAGALHTFSGPDHLAALAPMVAKQPKGAARLGAMWGFGHGLGVVLLGLAGIWAHQLVELQVVTKYAEFLVGGLLILLGLHAIYTTRKLNLTEHRHDASEEHIHIDHGSPNSHNQAHVTAKSPAIWVGVIHGVAGGNIIGLLPTLTLTPSDAALYLFGYFASAILSMSLFAHLVGHLTSRLSGDKLKALLFGTGALAIGVGVVWIVVTL